MVSCGLISISVARRVGALVLGGVFLWQVAEKAVPADCEAVVHVFQRDVVASMDGQPYPFAIEPYSPLVFAMRPGRHRLTLSRSGQTICEQPFDLSPGEHVVLTPCHWTSPDEPKMLSTAIPQGNRRPPR